MVEDRLLAYTDLGPNGFVNPSTGRPYSRKHLIDMMRRRQWPAAVQVSPNRVAWWLSELTQHRATLPLAKSVAQSLRGPADAAPAKLIIRRGST